MLQSRPSHDTTLIPFTFRRPRPGTAILAVAVVLFGGWLGGAIAGGTARLAAIIVGLALAAAVLHRWASSEVRIDESGVTDAGIVLTRAYPWDAVRAARLSKDEALSIGAGLVLDLPNGRHRLVVAGRSADPRPDWPLQPAADAINGRARAAASGRATSPVKTGIRRRARRSTPRQLFS